MALTTNATAVARNGRKGAAFARHLLIGAAALALFPNAAFAQTADESAESEDSTIIVTGTMLRGVVPTGTNVIGVTAADVGATGAVATAQLLQTVPQLGSFNNLQSPAGFGNSVTVNRPNLRNLPGNTTAGGSTTLVLLDGHRMVGAGITSTTPDPDAIPPGAIERLEVVADGGSAIYGSDAVAGVLNFITRKKFDGVQVGGHYGFADNYYQWDANVTVGRDWGSGGIYASYAYSKNDKIFGRDRDYVRSFPISTGLLPLNCNPGNVQITTAGVTTNYGLPGKAPVANQCEISDDAVVYPGAERHSAMVGFTQDLSDALTIDIKAYYTHRDLDMGLGQFHPGAVTLNATNPFFAAHRIGAEASHTVTYSFGPAEATRQQIGLETYGITPTLTYKIGDNWQLRAFGNFGESDTESHQKAFNATALSNSIAAGLFNPYDPASSDAAAVGIISNFETFGHTRQQQTNFRAVLDGELFNLPGGAVKVAVGGEYLSERFKAQFGATVPGAENSGAAAQLIGVRTIAPAVNRLPVFDLSRNVKSAFGEVVIPLFSSDNAMGGFQELRVSLAGRYDDYSDVGHTFNPKVGVSWTPFEGISLRGSWGKSFNAPSLADTQAADFVTIIMRGANQFGPTAAQQASGGGAYPNVVNGDVVFLRRGNSPGIQPQKAETWSLGGDFTAVPGLKLSATYYNISLKGVIDLPNTTPSITFRDFRNVILLGSELPGGQAAFAAALLASATAPLNNSTACLVGGVNTCNIYAFVDLAKNNQGDFKTSGLDLAANFVHDTGFGSVGLDVNANYELSRKLKNSPTTAAIDLLAANNSRFRIRSSVNATFGNLLAQATWSHTAGYKVDPVVGFIPQSNVASYDVFDLFFRYKVAGEGIMSDLELTLNVNNVFDKDPPEYRLFDASKFNAEGFINGNTLGRMIQVGISKKF